MQCFYSKKLNPNKSNITELNTAITQSNKVSQIHWKEFTETRNSDIAQDRILLPEIFMQIAGDLGETTAWGILTAQAFESGNSANFIDSSFCACFNASKKYGLLDGVKLWH